MPKGLLALIGGAPGGEGSSDEKTEKAKAVYQALRDKDEDAFADALETYVHACIDEGAGEEADEDEADSDEDY